MSDCLGNTSPHRLILMPSAEIRALALASHPIAGHEADLLDHVLRTRVIDVLFSTHDPSVLAERHGELVRMIPHRVRASLPEWGLRWKGITDLLQARIGQLQNLDAEAVRWRLSVPPTCREAAQRLDTVAVDHGLAVRLADGSVVREVSSE